MKQFKYGIQVFVIHISSSTIIKVLIRTIATGIITFGYNRNFQAVLMLGQILMA